MTIAHCLNPYACQNQGCRNVDLLSREFMNWFIEARAMIPRQIPRQVDEFLTAMFKDHSGQCGEVQQGDITKSWELRKLTIYNLIHELRNPSESRPGFIRPEDNMPIQKPWIYGHRYIHGVLGWNLFENDDIVPSLYDAMLEAMRDRYRQAMGLSGTIPSWG